MSLRVSLDQVDRALLRALQADGRASYADLAAHVGLSAPAVRARVGRMQDAGVLQVVAVTDPLTLGFPTMAMVGITVEGDARHVADALGSLPEVIYVVLTFGGYDLFVEVVCSDTDALLVLLNAHIRTVPGVVRAEAFPYAGIHTHRFTWEVPGPSAD